MQTTYINPNCLSLHIFRLASEGVLKKNKSIKGKKRNRRERKRNRRERKRSKLVNSSNTIIAQAGKERVKKMGGEEKEENKEFKKIMSCFFPNHAKSNYTMWQRLITVALLLLLRLKFDDTGVSAEPCVLKLPVPGVLAGLTVTGLDALDLG